MSPTKAESRVQKRLEEGARTLESLDRDRSVEHDASLGKAVEQRIVQRELLELELQDVDEQLERIRIAREQINE